MSARAGFTLVEVLISVAIAVFLITGIYTVLNVANASWSVDMGMLDLSQQARQAMDGCLRELRQSKSSGISITNGGAKVEFSIPNVANSIAYYLQNNQLIREHPAGTEKILANSLSSLTFSLSGNVFSIQLGMAKTVQNRELSFSLFEKVRLRNE